jgi:hypothetical protein
MLGTKFQFCLRQYNGSLSLKAFYLFLGIFNYCGIIFFLMA